MTFLRRLYLLLINLAILSFLAVLLLAPLSITGFAGGVSELNIVLRVIFLAVIGGLLLWLLYLQIRPAPKTEHTGLMMRAGGTLTEVSVESTRDRILRAVGDVPDVLSVEAVVKPVKGRADIELDVMVSSHDVRLPNKQKEIERALKQVINKQLGLQIAGRPRVRIQFYGEKPVQAPVVSRPVEREIPAPPVPKPEPAAPVTAPVADTAPDEPEVALPASIYDPEAQIPTRQITPPASPENAQPAHNTDDEDTLILSKKDTQDMLDQIKQANEQTEADETSVETDMDSENENDNVDLSASSAAYTEEEDQPKRDPSEF